MAPQKSYKSFRYRAQTAWTSARRGTLSAAGRANVAVGSPPEFKGDGDVWAPEELLVGSLNTCLLLTFLTLAQARGLRPTGYESDAEGLLENVEGKYRMTKVTVRPRVAAQRLASWPQTGTKSGRWIDRQYCQYSRSFTGFPLVRAVNSSRIAW